MSRYKCSPKTVHENYDYFGRIVSRIDVIDKTKESTKNKSLVTKHWCYLSILGLIAISIILAASLILNFWKRPALYNESCVRRSCLTELNMKCINKTCVCTADQYYSNKCEDKKSYMNNCESSSTHCKSNLKCRDGYCKCTSDQYWNETKCFAKRKYSESCTTTEQCDANQMVYCDPINLICSCPSNR
jgi:hypothetical protein